MKHSPLFIKFLFLKLTLSLCLCFSKPLFTMAKQGFAIVIDPKSYAEAQAEVNQYAQILEQKQGFKVYIIKDIWQTPHDIKAQLKQLYVLKKDALVGAVFIGDIPIAMIRKAQRLTSAFKRNEKNLWRESSIPSDRYYEDFQMRFSFLKKDALYPFYYYALSPSSRQHLKPNIFSGRIKPTNYNGISKYEHLRRYLKKVVAYKRNPKTIQQVLFFTGYGYTSNSFVARMHEMQNLYEHFPSLKKQNNALNYLDFRFQQNTKIAFINAMQNPNTDFALLHHHGSPNTQYLDANKPATTAEEAQQLIQVYGRSYVRKQVNKGVLQDSALNVLTRHFNVSNAWFNNALNAKMKVADSLNDAHKNLTIADFSIYSYQPRVKMVVLDACFNGSFHLDSCMASAYIFNNGQTIACIANSVNVLQDKWADHFLGLMQQGLYAGNVARLSGLMESHCIGDPTFCFESTHKNILVNNIINQTNAKGLRKYITTNAPIDVACLAMNKLFEQNKLSSDALLHIFQNTSSALLRMQSLTLLGHCRDKNFITAITLGANNANEGVQRMALNYLGKSGDSTLVPVLIEKLLDTNLSPRCYFSIVNALSFYSQTALQDALDSIFTQKEIFLVNKKQVYAHAKHLIENNANKWWEGIYTAINEKEVLKRRLTALWSTRNYCPHNAIELLIKCAETTKEEQVKKAIIESLGWRYYSIKVPFICRFLKKTIKNDSISAEIKEEAEQSLRALQRQ